ncbi:TPA: KUP/HAK/KT family potassium transporter [Streptococcus agalactiae]
MQHVNHSSFDKASKAGFIIALGIVYGDIGTSPLYTMQSLVENQGGISSVTESFILGSISLIIWTLTLITTIKYVLVALKADNHHEGGIFSLYTLVRKMTPWLIVPAVIGGATLLSDGALTPAVTVTSAVEGLKVVPSLQHIFQNQSNVIFATLFILLLLFAIQRFGTGVIGKLFGPIMFIWFAFLGISGLLNSFAHPEVFKAINPYYGLKLLFSPENHKGIFILGSIFLATTGAEALYSDLGHVGRGNIHVSWPFVKVAITTSIVLLFKTSAHMEAAYGLAITITMLMTTILLSFFLIQKGVKRGLVLLMMIFFGILEGIFFLASAVKFMHGGYVVVIIAVAIIFIMTIWYKGSKIVSRYVKLLDLKDYIGQLDKLRHDHRYPIYHTNVVYLTNRMEGDMIDKSIMYSILDKRPKKAQVYWFVNIKVTDEPYTADYKVDMMGTDFIVKVELYLGFKMRQTVSRYLRTIVEELLESGRLPKQGKTYSVRPDSKVGDFRFIVLDERFSSSQNLKPGERFVMLMKSSVKHWTATPIRWFGLQFSEVTTEVVPLIFTANRGLPIKEKIELTTTGD